MLTTAFTCTAHSDEGPYLHVRIEVRRRVRSQRDERVVDSAALRDRGESVAAAKVAGRRVAGRGCDASHSQAFKALLLRQTKENEDGGRNVG